MIVYIPGMPRWTAQDSALLSVVMILGDQDPVTTRKGFAPFSHNEQKSELDSTACSQITQTWDCMLLITDNGLLMKKAGRGGFPSQGLGTAATTSRNNLGNSCCLLQLTWKPQTWSDKVRNTHRQ